MANNNFKYTLEKNKQKIILGASIVGVLAVSFGVFTMVNKEKPVAPEDEIAIDTENIRAEFVVPL